MRVVLVHQLSLFEIQMFCLFSEGHEGHTSLESNSICVVVAALLMWGLHDSVDVGGLCFGP